MIIKKQCVSTVPTAVMLTNGVILYYSSYKSNKMTNILLIFSAIN